MITAAGLYCLLSQYRKSAEQNDTIKLGVDVMPCSCSAVCCWNEPHKPQAVTSWAMAVGSLTVQQLQPTLWYERRVMGCNADRGDCAEHAVS
jgi:hypothetical protein